MRRVAAASVLSHLVRCAATIVPSGPPSSSSDPQRERAHQALLQFNVMVAQGIEPDVLMYSALISTMARARLEWQAYKLFARMLEQGLTPLPETYQALREATHPSRKKVIEGIEAKVRESVATLPTLLHDTLAAAERDESAAIDERMRRYLSGDLPEKLEATAPTAATAGGPASGGAGAAQKLHGNVVLKGIGLTWSTHEHIMEQASDAHRVARDDERVELEQRLERLHEEELRVFLTSRRQLRHGAKAELLRRVVATVPVAEIESMLKRRREFFQRMAETLRRQVESAGGEETLRVEAVGAVGAVGAPRNQREGADVVLEGVERLDPREELLSSQSDALETPWGVLRRPLRDQRRTGAVRNALRDTDLTDAELDGLHAAVTTGDIDRVPEADLRRYARMHRLKWKRGAPRSLHEAVAWHITTFGPRGDVQPAPTPSMLELRGDAHALHRTVELHNALHAIATRTQHLQIVDSREAQTRVLRSNHHIRKERERAEDATRRERNLRAAAELRRGAREVNVPGGGDGGGGGADVGESASELPPWALRLGPGPFDLRRGEFLPPSNLARGGNSRDSPMTAPSIVESGMGNFVAEAPVQRKHVVDRAFLPEDVRRTAEAQEERERDIALQLEAEEARRSERNSYVRARRFYERARGRKLEKRDKDAERAADEADYDTADVAPPGRRMSQVLRSRRN